MKLSDISQELTEKPGGFGGIMKAKAKKQLSPFMKQRQQAAGDDERLIKVAREIKKSLKGWMNKALKSSGGAKAPLSMAQFLGWVKKTQPKYAKGIESYARGESAYAEHFSQAIDSKGKQSSTATDPGVKVRSNKPHQVAGDGDNLELEKEPVNKKKENDETRAAYKRMGDELEAERIESEKGEKQDIKASKGDDKEPKVDTSASIYEARLKALLEADEEVDADVESDEDVGTNRSKVLDDNQIDTLITMGIEKQIELDGGESIIDDPSELSSQGVSEPAPQSKSNAGGDDFLEQFSNELERVLTKVAQGAKLDKHDQRNASNMLGAI